MNEEAFVEKFLNESVELVESLTQEFTSSLSLSLKDDEEEKQDESLETNLKIVKRAIFDLKSQVNALTLKKETIQVEIDEKRIKNCVLFDELAELRQKNLRLEREAEELDIINHQKSSELEVIKERIKKQELLFSEYSSHTIQNYDSMLNLDQKIQSLQSQTKSQFIVDPRLRGMSKSELSSLYEQLNDQILVLNCSVEEIKSTVAAKKSWLDQTDKSKQIQQEIDKRVAELRHELDDKMKVYNEIEQLETSIFLIQNELNMNSKRRED